MAAPSDPMRTVPRNQVWTALAASLGFGLLTILWAVYTLHLGPLLQDKPLLLAPMLGQLEACLVQDGLRPDFPAEFQQVADACLGLDGSAAHMVRPALDALAPLRTGSALELGYTLPVPLLRYVVWTGADWQVRGAALDRVVRTLAQVDRPAILYLFATHFQVHAQAEQRLAQDAENLAATPHGPLPLGRFMGDRIYPWSVARQDNDITRVRRMVIDALAQRLCAAPAALAHLRAITLLGETHHLFPDFEAGMGFAAEGYAVSDYSAASIEGFRNFLRQRHGSIGRLNVHLQSDFSSFATIEPPARNIRSEQLDHFWQHIDSYAAGTLPVSGWVHVPDMALQKRLTVAVWVDGKPHARARVQRHRQDVRQARPGFLTADVGWRVDIHYPALGEGRHRIDVLLQDGPGPRARRLGLLATREVVVMDRQQGQPRLHAAAALPDVGEPPAGLEFSVDSPGDQLALFHNPLVQDWHAFRAQQVADYILAFSGHLASGCLGAVPRFSHQINPHPNPSWDAARYAVDRSLQPLPGLNLGVSLYGADSHSPDLGRMLRRQQHRSYGITEFHPLEALPPGRLGQVLRMHQRQGAQFLSFFLESRAPDADHTLVSNEFSFDAHNPAHGSDALHRSLRQVLQGR